MRELFWAFISRIIHSIVTICCMVKIQCLLLQHRIYSTFQLCILHLKITHFAFMFNVSNYQETTTFGVSFTKQQQSVPFVSHTYNILRAPTFHPHYSICVSMQNLWLTCAYSKVCETEASEKSCSFVKLVPEVVVAW